MANINDVAKKAKVSKATVSNVFNNKKNVSDEIRTRVYKLAKELDYFPNKMASGLAKNSTGLVGLYLDNVSGLRQMDTQLIEGVAIGLKKYDKNLILYLNPGKIRENKYLTIEKKFEIEPFDSAILIAPMVKDIRINELIKVKKPLVLVGKPSGYYMGLKYVDVDNVQISYDITKTLTGLGHRKIALINSEPNLTISMDRLQGYLDALKETNVEFDPRYVYNTESSEIMGEDITNILLNLVEFTAIIVHSDEIALGVYKELKENGKRIPEDVSVFSLGGTDYNLEPELSTVVVDYKLLGSEAVNKIFDTGCNTDTLLNAHKLKFTNSIAPCIK